MPTYRDQAIVLRTHKLAEADRIVTVLARERGKIRIVAKGVRRTKSRFGARLEPGMIVDLQCYEGRALDTVTQAESLASFGEQIARDYRAYTALSTVLETADRLTEERAPALQQFLLLGGALAALASREHDASLVLDAYLIRGLAISGYAPSFHDCAQCGDPGPHLAFNVASGGAVCPTCRRPGSVVPARGTLELLAALLAGDWECADASSPAHRREGSGITAAYVQWHLERALRSLPHVEREPVATLPTRTRVGPARRSMPPPTYPGTSPSSWTATVAGPISGACPARKAMRRGRRRSLTWSPEPSRWG